MPSPANVALALSSGATMTPRRSLAVVGAIVVSALMFSVALLPAPEERAEVYAAEGRVMEAIAVFESVRERRHLSTHEAFALANLYRSTGRVAPLTGLLIEELALRPGSNWALVELSHMGVSAGTTPAAPRLAPAHAAPAAYPTNVAALSLAEDIAAFPNTTALYHAESR